MLSTMPLMPSHDFAICALATRNYRFQAVTLLESARRQHPDISLYLLEVDPTGDAPDDARLAGVHLLRPTDVIAPARFAERLGRYDALALSCSLKAALLGHVLDRGHGKALYLDVDMRVYQGLHGAVDALDTAAIALSPHSLVPLPNDGDHPSDVDFLQDGLYNGGFLGVRGCAEGRRFLAWWDDKLHTQCFDAKAEGLFLDQKWLNFVPILFTPVAILRDPGYNVAYWNLDDRPLTRDGDGYRAGGAPLTFFHFSGFDPTKPERLSAHRSRPLAGPTEALEALLAAYAERLIANGRDRDRAIPYGHPLPARPARPAAPRRLDQLRHLRRLPPDELATALRAGTPRGPLGLARVLLASVVSRYAAIRRSRSN